MLLRLASRSRLLQSKRPLQSQYVRQYHQPPRPSTVPPWRSFPYATAFFAFGTISAVSYYYDRRRRRKRGLEDRNPRGDAEALRILGRVLYSVVSQEEGVEDKVILLLRELTRNQATHEAIAKSALPLLLRKATTSVDPPSIDPNITPIVNADSTKEAALRALDNLSHNQHILEAIMATAFDCKCLVPLLTHLGTVHSPKEASFLLGTNLNKLMLTSSVGVYCRTLEEIKQLTDIVVTTDLGSVRRFALRVLEDTLRNTTVVVASPKDLDWKRLLSCGKMPPPLPLLETKETDTVDDVALLSLLHVATTTTDPEKRIPQQMFNGNDFQMECGSTLIDYLIAWSTKLPTTATSSENKSTQELLVCRTFALQILANLTSSSASAASVASSQFPSTEQLECLRIANEECMAILRSASTLPPGTASITKVGNLVRRNVTLLSIIIKNVIEHSNIHDRQELWCDKAWGDVAIEWLRDEQNPAVQKVSAEILVLLMERGAGKGHTSLNQVQYHLLEAWMEAVAVAVASFAPAQTEHRVHNELLQGMNKPIKDEMISIISSGDNDGGNNDGVLPIKKKTDKITGDTSRQSHALKALALVFESPENALCPDPLLNNSHNAMEQALTTFIDLHGWDAVEILMDLDKELEDQGEDDGEDEYVNGRQHDYCIKNTARLVANILSCDLAYFHGRFFQNISSMRKTEWVRRLDRWSKENSRRENRTDCKIMHHARRAAQHLALYDNDNKDFAIYADHLFPVHGIDMDFSSTSSLSSASSTGTSVAGADIVFIHGISGGAFASWNQEIIGKQAGNYTQFWPRLWVPSDLERRTKRSCRVLSVGYEARPLRTLTEVEATSSCSLDMEEQAESLLKKLHLAHVGSDGRPVVFVCHSLGGLIVKKMLMLAHESSSTKETNLGDIGQNTKAVVFYAVPHKGSPLMDILLQPKDIAVASGVVVAHPIVKWLLTTHAPTIELNKEFGRIYGNTALSIGETKKETLPGLLDMDITAVSDMLNWILDDSGLIQIVPPTSSNPGFGSFELLDAPHTTINKPINMEDRRYLSMMEFIASKCI